MANIFNIGASALGTAQRQLNTAGHNIANVNTDGFSRQRVELAARPAQGIGGLFIGSGVSANAVNRIADGFLTTQLRAADTSAAQASQYHAFASRVDNILGDGSFSSGLDGFFSAIQDANGSPSSTAAREIMLNSASSFADRFRDIEQRLSSIATDVNTSMKATVERVNALSISVANINGEIVRASGGNGSQPNDLLDQRDRLISDLSNLVGAQTIAQSDGSLNVFIGTGQPLVVGSTALPLTTVDNPLDPTRLEVATISGASTTAISSLITKGELGASLSFRDDILDPTRNSLGRLAATLTVAFNEQHREGFDINDNFGADLFSIGSPAINPDPGNSGTVSIALDQANVDGLTLADYRLDHDGANFTLTNLLTGAAQALTGAGPFAVDGIAITVTSAPAAGDSYLLQPTKSLARNMSVSITDPREVALARPHRTSAELANIGNATIESASVVDITDANILVPTQLVFNDPPSTFQIGGVGPLIPYASGSDIDINGWRAQISGSPLPGDIFSINPNFGGTGDNGNGLALADIQLTKILDGATTTLQESYSQLVGSVGSKTSQAEISRDALEVLQSNAQATRDSLSAVSLDEEAADLLRFQQAYSAAAQVISIANETFNSLLAAVRR
ncbi:MAG: flagellar hook-associated protein 1 FlgK [Gammaproteobacteria bacterium]|jgi:flagellar hook-associated protein 1 FlgK